MYFTRFILCVTIYHCITHSNRCTKFMFFGFAFSSFLTVERGECMSDGSTIPKHCIQNDSTECIEWFHNNISNRQKLCVPRPYSGVKSYLRLLYRSLFDCYSRWCFINAGEQHNCVLIERFTRDSRNQTLESVDNSINIIIDESQSLDATSLDHIRVQLANQTSSPFHTFIDFDNGIKPKKCFSAVSLTAHFTMTNSRNDGQDIKAFVHVGFEKNCAIFLFHSFSSCNSCCNTRARDVGC